MGAHGGPAYWWTEGTDAGRTHIATRGIVQDGLVLNLDAGVSSSYPGTGTTWTDLSGNGNNGTLINGVVYSENEAASLRFDGVDDYALDTDSQNLPIGNSSRTICVWFKPYNEEHNLVQIGTGGAGTGTQAYIVEFYRFGSLVYIYTDGINASNNLTISNDQFPALGEWNYFVFGNSGQVYFYYLNGLLQKTGTWPTSLNTIGQQYVVGKRLDYTSSTTNSNISSVKIYNRALSESEIRQNFNATRGRYGI